MKRPAQATGAASAAVAGAGAAIGVAAASACCVGPVISPLIVGVLGAGGAVWAADLEPYSLYILALSAVMLSYGFAVAYRRPRACAVGDDGGRPGDVRSEGHATASPRWLRITLWAAAVLWTASLAVNLLLSRLSK